MSDLIKTDMTVERLATYIYETSFPEGWDASPVAPTHMADDAYDFAVRPNEEQTFAVIVKPLGASGS